MDTQDFPEFDIGYNFYQAFPAVEDQRFAVGSQGEFADFVWGSPGFAGYTVVYAGNIGFHFAVYRDMTAVIMAQSTGVQVQSTGGIDTVGGFSDAWNGGTELTEPVATMMASAVSSSVVWSGFVIRSFLGATKAAYRRFS